MSPKRFSLPARLLIASAFALALPAYAAPSVVASLTQPPGGLGCAEAADQAQVVFDFHEPRSDLKQISVFIDGKGVPERAIAEEWPRLTLLEGLHAGRNKVEVYATGANGKTEAHTLTVLAGEAPKAADKEDVAIVDCVRSGANRIAERARDRGDDAEDRGREVVAEASDDSEEIIEDVRPHVDDEDEEDVDRVVYEDAPVYVYRPYPAWGFVSYYPAYYYGWPYAYGYYGYGGYPRYYYGGHSYYYGGPGHHQGGSRGYTPGRYWDRGGRNGGGGHGGGHRGRH